MKKSILYLSILMYSFLSCTGQGNTKEGDEICPKTITIDTKNPVTENSEALLIDEVQLLPLMKNKETFINDIAKLKIVKDKIIISDYQTHQIVIFSMKTGAVVGKISARGKGPNEYTRIDDFYVDERLQYIEILDGSLKKIMKYNFNGEFIKSIKIPFSFSSFSKIREDFVFTKGISKNKQEWMYQLFIWDEKEKVRKKYIKVNPENTTDVTFSSKSPLRITEKSLNFLPIYIPKIYNIDEKLELNLKYCLDFGDAWIKDKLAYATKGVNPLEQMRNIYKSGKVYFVNYLEGDKYVLIHYSLGENNDMYTCLYNKITEKSKVYKSISSNLCFGNEFIAYYNGYFVCIKQPFELKEYLKNSSDKLLDDNLKSIIEKSEETDNPILMLAKFK